MSGYDKPIMRKPKIKSGDEQIADFVKEHNLKSVEIDLVGAVREARANQKPKLTLPTDSEERKNYPLLRGCLKYFPAALAGVANVSKRGNDKHNPGQELHHARGKSMDHGDCILRHLMDAEDLKAQGATKEEILFEASQLAWRALAYSQELHEFYGAPVAPGAKK